MNKYISKLTMPFYRSSVWLWLSIAAALIAIVGNVIALTQRSIYSNLTPVFLPQAIAQDIANLTIVAPLWLILVTLALRGSFRAYLVWLGVISFTVYNYVIYTFSVPFGPIFLLWVAVLGLSLFTLIGGITTVDHEATRSSFTSKRANTLVAWFLIITAILFGLLWLSEDVPALLSGNTPKSVIDMALPTNPVHVLDYAFFLPAVIVIGVMLLKGKALSYTITPSAIVFLILTGIPILITPVIQSARNEVAGWGVVVPIGTLTIISVGLLAWLLSTINPFQRSETK